MLFALLDLCLACTGRVGGVLVQEALLHDQADKQYIIKFAFTLLDIKDQLLICDVQQCKGKFNHIPGKR